uniref:Uncharacterized protein n=1 Tax=Ditylum brightwellii TaxID=49249 RepID=A0A7S1ZXL1_9STRA
MFIQLKKNYASAKGDDDKITMTKMTKTRQDEYEINIEERKDKYDEGSAKNVTGTSEENATENLSTSPPPSLVASSTIEEEETENNLKLKEQETMDKQDEVLLYHDISINKHVETNRTRIENSFEPEEQETMDIRRELPLHHDGLTNENAKTDRTQVVNDVTPIVIDHISTFDEDGDVVVNVGNSSKHKKDADKVDALEQEETLSTSGPDLNADQVIMIAPLSPPITKKTLPFTTLENDSTNKTLQQFRKKEDEEEEETLLCVNFSIHDISQQDVALDTIRSYVCSFPFAAVLPVQPLTYLPTDDRRGLDVTFLRKKTKEKGSVDGGIQFLVDFVSEEDENDDEAKEARRIQLVATRNSEGQTIGKIFSEKLIVQAFVSGISGERNDGNNLSEFVAIESMFHKWM